MTVNCREQATIEKYGSFFNNTMDRPFFGFFDNNPVILAIIKPEKVKKYIFFSVII